MRYQTAASWALLIEAAENRTGWLRAYANMGDRALGPLPAWGMDQWPSAFVIPKAQHDTQALHRLVWTLQHGQVEFRESTAPVTVDGTTYPAGSFPRYSPVSGVAGASAQQLGCCEQLDQDADAILLAWLTSLTDSSLYDGSVIGRYHKQVPEAAPITDAEAKKPTEGASDREAPVQKPPAIWAIRGFEDSAPATHGLTESSYYARRCPASGSTI